jgi:hypothetical protein
MPPKKQQRKSSKSRPDPEEWNLLGKYETLRKKLMLGGNHPKKPHGKLSYGLLPPSNSTAPWPMVVGVTLGRDAKIYRWDYTSTAGMKDARFRCRDCNAVVSLKSGEIVHKVQTLKAHKGKPCLTTKTGHAAEAIDAVRRWAALRSHVEGIAAGEGTFSQTRLRKWMALAVAESASLNYSDLGTEMVQELTTWACRLTDDRSGNLDHFLKFFSDKMIQGEKIIHKLNGLSPWNLQAEGDTSTGVEDEEEQDEAEIREGVVVEEHDNDDHDQSLAEEEEEEEEDGGTPENDAASSDGVSLNSFYLE